MTPNRRLAAVAALWALALSACAKRTVEGRWHLDREHTTMPMGFNLPGESYLEIKVVDDGVVLRDSIATFETGNKTLVERRYPFGKEVEVERSGPSTLYTSARLDGHTLFTQERLVSSTPSGAEQKIFSVTYVVSANGLQLVGTDENGKVATYERQ